MDHRTEILDLRTALDVLRQTPGPGDTVLRL